MDIREKIIKALSERFLVQHARLEADDGISGFVVSPRFQGMSTLDRQRLIDDALRGRSARLTDAEKRQVLMIAALTPDEHEAVGARVRVDKVKALAGGTVEVRLQGAFSDAEYVRGALNNQKGVQTTEPRHVACAAKSLMSFRAKATGATPLTKARVIRILKSDHYIQLMPNV